MISREVGEFISGIFTGMYHLLCVYLDEVQYFDSSIHLHTHQSF